MWARAVRTLVKAQPRGREAGQRHCRSGRQSRYFAPGRAAADLGKGAAGAGKDIGIGAGKGAGKIGEGSAKGVGKLGGKIFHRGSKNKDKNKEKTDG